MVFDVTETAVPEPGGLVLLVAALPGFGATQRRHRRVA
jgi:hypothetical protein